MKFLTFVDVHQDKKALKQLLQRAKKPDIDFIICAGDISIFGRGLREGIEMFSNLGKKFYFIPGNHEDHLKNLDKLLGEFSNCINFHEKVFKIGDYVFLGYGGDGFSMEDANFRKLARKWYGEYKDKKIVLVTHGPPFDTKLDLLDDRHVGNKDYRKFIERISPKLNICGHLHETAGEVDKIGNCKIIHPGWDGMVIELK